MKYFWIAALPLLLAACSPDHQPADSPTATTPTDTAQWVVDRAIAAHGGPYVENSRIEFDFRDRHYVSERRGGQFTYERIWQDSSGDHYRDVLSNEGLYREINDERVQLSAKDSAAYANSVNSVLYFALLPYYLNDPAVRKTYLGRTRIKGREYHEVKVTFKREGGGKDYEDEFVYWFATDDYTMDYLAYNYLTDGGGARFREAYNVRNVAGIRFADYVNYQPIPDTKEVEIFDKLFNEGALRELSRIESANVEVQLLDTSIENEGMRD